jgi:hypothetical protein
LSFPESTFVARFDNKIVGFQNSQTNGLELTIESSILTDLILGKTAEEELHCKKHPQTSEEVQFNQCISKFESTQQLHQLQHKPRS